MPNISGTMFLNIVKGIAKTPQDSTSAEQGLDEINLLDPNGFSCEDYQIKIPSMKSSAVYADSPITDGRTLISGALGNVRETMRLTLNASTMVQLAAMLSKLARFKQDCNDFWDSFNQIEPVYIKHQIDGEPGPRYALLYDIDIDIESPIDPSTPMRTVTLSIEREFGWRGVAPGDNPKRWTNYKNSLQFNSSNAGLDDTDFHLVSETILNGVDLTTRNQFTDSNAITIPANKIDGDLPALLFVNFDPGSASSWGTILMGLDSRPITLPDNSGGVNQLRALSVIGSLGVPDPLKDASLVNDTGASRYLAESVSGRRIEVTFATVATDAARWQNIVDLNTYRGRYMMYARVRQHTGAQNDLQYYVTVGHGQTSPFYTSPTLNPLLTGTSGNTTSWNLDYLGVVTLPPYGNSYSQVSGGKGLYVTAADDTNGNLFFILHAARVAGTTARLCFNDIVLIPMDEYVIMTVNGDSSYNTIFDNTGYLAHGKLETIVESRALNISNVPYSLEYRGQVPMLRPKIENRLVFMGQAQSSNLSNARANGTVHIDIVPRWIGYRDI